MKAIAFLRNVVKECLDDDIFGLAAEMAYWVIFSLFPFFILLAALTGIVGRAIGSQDLLENIMDNLYGAVGYSIAETLRGPLTEVLAPGSGALSLTTLVSALVALNTASSAIETAMKACNRAYGLQETRNPIAQKLIAIAFTLLLTVLLIGSTIALSIGGHLVRIFNPALAITGGFTAIRIGGALIGITCGFALLYWKSPNLRQPFRWVLPGVAVATVGVVAFTYLFGLFVRFFADATFNRTYGAIAGVILFLFFLRMASIIVLIGAEINAEIAREQGVLTPMARAQHVEAVAVTPPGIAAGRLGKRLERLLVRRDGDTEASRAP